MDTLSITDTIRQYDEANKNYNKAYSRYVDCRRDERSAQALIDAASTLIMYGDSCRGQLERLCKEVNDAREYDRNHQ